MTGFSAEAKERKNEEDDDDQSDKVDKLVHVPLLNWNQNCLPRRSTARSATIVLAFCSGAQCGRESAVPISANGRISYPTPSERLVMLGRKAFRLSARSWPADQLQGH